MASCTTGLKILVIKTFGSFDGSYSAVERLHHRECSVRVTLSRDATHQIAKQFEGEGNMLYKG
jgi:hypothetical protein